MATSTGIVWRSSPADMAKRVETYKRNLLAAVFRLAQEWAKQMADEMRATHPWINQTGEAERKLFGRAFRLVAGAVIAIGHGVDYGIYLERRWSGRYAVVMPTIQRNQAQIMKNLQALVR